jgi:integrase
VRIPGVCLGPAPRDQAQLGSGSSEIVTQETDRGRIERIALLCSHDRTSGDTHLLGKHLLGEALALRAADVGRDHLVLPNKKNPSRPVKKVYLSEGDQDLPGELPVYQRELRLGDEEPLFCSRKNKKGPDGRRRALTRFQAWRVVKAASERAGVRVLALRESRHGGAGAPAPVHPHLFRHARVRQLVRQTRSLPLAQRQAGWARLQMAYLTIGDDEARELMRQVTE